MRWFSKSIRRGSAVSSSAFAVTLVLAGGPVAAQTVETFGPAAAVVALEAGNGVGAGIGIPPGPVVAVFADGTRRQVVRHDGKLALSETAPAPNVAKVPAAAGNDVLPDGIVTIGRENIRRAWLTGPTGRYAHGILGDAIEASGLAIQRFDGKIFRYSVDDGSVFEDRMVRLVDLDRDGWDEVVVVQSYLDAGAALAVFALGQDSLRFVSEVPPIGTPNRWLNPAGADDFDGDGVVELAFVETPHIGGALKFYEFRDRRLVPDFEVSGFSNHAIGTREQFLSATLDWNGDGLPDLALPDGQRRSLRVIGFVGGVVEELARVPHAAPIVTAILATRLDDSDEVSVVYGLADGTLVAARP